MLLSLYPSHPVTQKYREQMAQLTPVPKVVTKPPVELTSFPTVAEAPDLAPKNSQPKPVDAAVEVSDELPEIIVEPIAILVESPDVSAESAFQHIVQAGENLYRISLKYNVKLARLVEWNQLESSANVFQGQQLWIVDPAQANNVKE
jgi:type IV pilus assembly protein PilF